MRKICVVSGSRADYGLLHLTMKRLQESKKIDFQLLVTGSHLSRSFGYTYQEILNDGFKANSKIKILNERGFSISSIVSRSIKLLSKEFSKLSPDIILLLGDRYEIFSAAISATLSKIPIAHIHGGEISEGAFDESFRHAITKMSHLHFASCSLHKKRIIQLGENPKNVFNVGAPGIERLKKLKLLSKDNLEKSLKIKFRKKNILVTFHPETLSKRSISDQISPLLRCLKQKKDWGIIITKANSDPGGEEINIQLKEFAESNSTNTFLFDNLGQLNYFSILKLVDVMIGNSSSAIIESASFNTPSINIGNRQGGRLKPKNVFDVKNKTTDIMKALDNLSKKRDGIKNPYDGGQTSKKILKVLEEFDLNNILKKNFFDIL